MLQDVRFAIRLFARQRAFFITAVLTIALGVGLSATVFAVVDGVLFRPLPYRVMSGTLRWIAAGLVCGLALALTFAQSLKPFVYQVPPNDPWTLGLVTVAFLAVAAAASYIPARRAARVDPMIALRAE